MAFFLFKALGRIASDDNSRDFFCQENGKHLSNLKNIWGSGALPAPAVSTKNRTRSVRTLGYQLHKFGTRTLFQAFAVLL